MIKTQKAILEYERLDKFITENFDISRTKSKKLILDSKVKINSKIIISPKTNVEIDDEVEVDIKVEIQSKLEPIEMDLDIVYEDEYFLIVNKETGIVVHPGAGTIEPTLANGLLFYLKENISNKEDNIRPGIVHRLDKNTEGLLIIAKNDEVHVLLQNMMAKREIKKFYRALVEGSLEHTKGMIDAPIMRDPKFRQKFLVGNKNAKEAQTKFLVKEIYDNFTLVEIELLTGRTHQIRVHFKYIKHPIANDEVYGRKIKSNLFEEYSQFLQAYKLSFKHPITKKDILVELEMPKIFDVLINY